METPKEFTNNTIEIISSNIVLGRHWPVVKGKKFNVVSLSESFEGLQ